ncbi:MAG: hypothetical protein ACLVHH_03475 [Faecalibacillus intestinalis]|uniref:hypothetical protein n=1 Tax=Faecalibacillus intestinalis TaxID=1982626 RepID=UPI00399AD1E1
MKDDYSKDEYDGVNTPMDMVITEMTFYLVINKGDDTIVALKEIKKLEAYKRIAWKQMKDLNLYLFRDKYLLVACKQGIT